LLWCDRFEVNRQATGPAHNIGDSLRNKDSCMFPFRRKALSKLQPSQQTSWHRAQRHMDTVIFVHGIIGKSETTWGNFLTLLHTDDDLPLLDILSWGYKTGFVPGSYQDVETEGDALISEIDLLISEHNQIFLVGHSMGGLVILKGLTNRILNQRGLHHPVTSVNRIVLYATPLFGGAVANVVLAGLQINRWMRLVLKVLPEKQLKDLRRGKFCDNLTTHSLELIYRPPADSLLVNRAIPVLACAGKHDPLVSKESAVGIFSTPAPKHLEGNHSTVKLPEHHGDPRYISLKIEIETGLSKSFHELCAKVTDLGAGESARRAAAYRLDEQYGEMMERCTQRCVAPRNITDGDRFEISSVIWSAGAKAVASPAQVMSQVYKDYIYKNDPRLKRG
jgi:pimeloyl-ACP methyl ester carboxylesterase